MLQWSDLKREKNFIAGEWVDAAGGVTVPVVDPSTGEQIGTVPNAGATETRRAIDAAAAAFEDYRELTAAERAKMLRDLSTAIMDHQAPLAELLTREQGKPLAEAKGEVGMSAAYILWFAEEARRIYGDVVPSPWKQRRILVTKEPVGVVAAITPWNFPSSMLARKIGPALAAGCTVVAKPAMQTPYSGLAWGVLAEQAGIPAGVLNIVTGSARDIGGELTSNSLVRKLTFTGSTPVGKLLLRQCADSVKKVSMELGGNAPFIVFDDADLDRAVEGAIAAKFRNAGQTCVCTNRVYVQSGIYDRFVKAFADATLKLVVGSGFDAGVTQGPLIDDDAVSKVEEFVADAVSKGGRIVTGGKRHARGGLFFEPTVIAQATASMKFAREEIFGPLAPVFRFETEDEVVRAANDTEYGLACYFYTGDLGRAMRVSEKLEYGLVGINEGLITTEVAPFGGYKESGVGREGSKYGIEDYLQVKYTCIGGLGA
ncbi:NAD-dependent succinate-semialdehyde dehydrogenase [Variovorax sp. E3]|uniref:NAD-dependent succinate-semialdehyde dehydrogenase n=1 Tax=Variovorax sp. E3 TaxID=1914993 RepID=UPI0018DE85B7|nr:NAD-dependent succinate-semialdehyde dehydrogenase [Variovorax sp. E3]